MKKLETCTAEDTRKITKLSAQIMIGVFYLVTPFLIYTLMIFGVIFTLMSRYGNEHILFSRETIYLLASTGNIFINAAALASLGVFVRLEIVN